ncbi:MULTISPECIES: NUDIX hydrolase [Bacillaceae]|uniref:NUDIX domain-containing protein n=1 Tax=Evansella alkalicola TaxID=745819 RepID=A0ABS6JQI7_9BACI|nr:MULTISPECIES: NUDIX domain-containing protein [Bacillaceae]MBU9720376.1 NUDIX domain-containing protein [Bacillus alkalicola]
MDYIQYLRSMVGKSKVMMVVAGAFVFDEDNRLLLQQRSDTGQWGLPGGFMEFDETVQDTARREVFEETGLYLGKLELFGIYSGKDHEKIFPNGDEVAKVQIIFTCKEFSGELVRENSESIQNDFFKLNELPKELFTDHKQFFNDYFSDIERPVIK